MRRSHVAVLGVYLVLAVLLFWTAWAGPAGEYVGGPGDPEAHMWFMRWVPFALTHAKNPLFSHYAGYPDGVNAMWNSGNAVLLPSLVLSPVTAVFGAVTAFNLLATLAVVLSAFCAYLMCARFVSSTTAATFGGLLYGFSPYMASHSIGHIGLTLIFTAPLVVIVLDEFLVRGRLSPVKAGVWLGILGAVQLLTAEEILLTEAIAGAVGLVVLCAFHRDQVRQRIIPSVRALAVGTVVFVVLCAVPLAVQFLGPLRIKGIIRPPDIYVNDLLNFVLPTSLQLIHPAFSDNIVANFTGNASEQNGYVGVGLIVLLVLVVIRFRRQPVVPVMALAALLIAVFSMGPHLHIAGHVTSVPMPWKVGRLPLLNQVLPSRLMLFFYLFAAVLLAIYCDALARSPRVATRVAGSALLLLALVPLVPLWPYPAGSTPQPSFFTAGGVKSVRDGSVALIAPYSQLDYDALLWQADADMRFRMPEGNYLRPSATGGPQNGPLPTATSETMVAIQTGKSPPQLDSALRGRIESDLTGWNIETVIVGPMKYQAQMLDFFTTLYGRPPAADGGVFIWRGLPPATTPGD